MGKEFNSLPLKPCRHAGCTELVRGGGYCAKHKNISLGMLRSVGRERRESAAWHYLYDTVRWRKMRAAQLIAEPFCRSCAKAGIRRRADDVDHIIPHRGDKKIFYDASNLQSLCHSCHSRKTIAERTGTLRPPENV